MVNGEHGWYHDCWWLLMIYYLHIYCVYIYVCVWRFPKMTPQRAPLEAFSRRSLMTEIICSLWDLDPDLCSWSEISRCSTSFCCCCCCCCRCRCRCRWCCCCCCCCFPSKPPAQIKAGDVRFSLLETVAWVWQQLTLLKYLDDVSR